MHNRREVTNDSTFRERETIVEADHEVPRVVEEEFESSALPDDAPEADRRLLHDLNLFQLELASRTEELHVTMEALEQSQQRFRYLYADAPIGFFTIGIQGRILECNRRGAAHLRLTTVTATRRRITEFMTAENAARFSAKIAALYRTKMPTTFDCEMRRADGTNFWAEFAMSIAEDTVSGANVCQVVMSDISDRKRMQDDAARLVAIVASSTQAIVSQDLDGVVRSWNSGAERLFGYPAEAMIGHRLAMLVPPERAGEDADIRRQVIQGKSVGVESVRLARDGRALDVFISAAPILRPNGSVGGVSSIISDISEQLAARREVAQLLEDLRQADRRKDDFIATLAHELRNPLAPIRNAAAVMRYAPDLNPKLQWCRDVIDRQVAHMAALLDDLLDVSRLTRDKINLRRDRVELGTAIAQAVEINRHVIESRGHKFTLDLAPQPIEVEGDITRLIQIFGNLLNNAAKYTQPGGEISITTLVSDGQVIVRVRDSGIGISPDHLTDIFDLFAQVDSAREGTEGGLGIGLALVKGLVDRHGGRIVARSDGLNSGSEFIVYLPLAPSVPARVTGDHLAIVAERPEAKPLQVLVVDDNVDAAESLAMILQAHHHQVRTAHDGQEALKLAAEQTPDVMVLDLGMPRLSGYEVARQVREQPWGGDVLLIACTGWGQPEDRRRSEESGFDHHLVKPVSASTVLRLVRQVEAREHD